MSSDADEFPDDPLVRQKVSRPGSLLMLVGLANLVFGFFPLQAGIHSLRLTPEQNRDEQREAARRLEEWGWGDPAENQKFLDMPPEAIKAYRVGVALGVAGLSLAGAFVITYGGYNLRALNSYPLAVAGAVLAAVPVVSPLGCCGVGQLVGLWALVVLMDRGVRAAFP